MHLTAERVRGWAAAASYHLAQLPSLLSRSCKPVCLCQGCDGMGCVCSKPEAGPSPPSVLYCRPPPGVQSHMLENVNLRKVTKLIRAGRLAPLYPHDLAQLDAAEECPICTVSYPSMNSASCCSARVCTECFVYHQTAADPPGKAQCPFCKGSPFAVRYLGSKPEEQLQQERAEEQIWRRAKQRRKLQQDMPAAHPDTPTSPGSAAGAAFTPTHTSQQPQQSGADLQHHEQQLQQQQQQQQQQQERSWFYDLSSSPTAADGGGNGSTSSSSSSGGGRAGSSSSGSRRGRGRWVEAISVYAGYHGRSSSSSGDADVSRLHDTSAAAAAAEAVGAEAVGLDGGNASSDDELDDATLAAILATAAAALAEEEAAEQQQQQQQQQQLEAAAAAEEQQEYDDADSDSMELLLLQQQQQQQLQQQQDQAWRARQLLELQLQHLDELQQLHSAGLLPGYAAQELSGLGLEELDEILLEQAVMESLQEPEADAQ